MRIALITNENLHHKYWVYTLYKNLNVKLIIHPKKKNLIDNLKSKNILRRGFLPFSLKLFSLIYDLISPYSIRNSLVKMGNIFFSDYKSKYESLPKNIIHKVSSINDSDCINLVKEKNIDVICFLGGEIAKKEIINSPNLISLNYHSGLSPYYNGSKTIFHAVADYYPNYSGGTLMAINQKIDGGDIFAHFLPSINRADTAASLFMKGIVGSTKLFRILIHILEINTSIKGLKQTNSKNYVTNLDWNILKDLKLFNFGISNSMKNFERGERTFTYFNNSTLFDLEAFLGK